MTSIYAFTSGQTLTASALNNALTNITPLMAVKAADTSRASTTVFADDPDLVLTPTINLTYKLEALLFYDAAAAGLIKFQVAGPAGATIQQVLDGLDTSVTAAAAGIVRMGRNSQALGSAGAGSVVAAAFQATVVMGSTPGNVTMQWAQNSSSGTASILKAQSLMWMTAIPQ